MSSPIVVYVGVADPRAGAPHQAMAAIHLARCGYAIKALFPVAARETRVVTPLAELDVVPYARVGISRLLSLFWQLLRLRVRHGSDALFYVQGSPSCPPSLLALCGVPRARVIYHTQDFLEPGKHRLWEFFERHFCRRAGRVISNDGSRARFLASYYGLGSVPAVVRTALPAGWPVPKRNFAFRTELIAKFGDPDVKCLIMVGGPYSTKRCSEELLRAVGTLPRCYGLVFTGAMPGSSVYRKTEEALVAAGLARRSVILGNLPYDELLEYVAACDVGILLYPDDGVGNYFQAPGRLTEYVACGVPVVSANFPGLELLVKKYDLGEVTAPTSVDEIAGAIRSVCDMAPALAVERRGRLSALAKSSLAYEAQAGVVTDAVDDARRASG